MPDLSDAPASTPPEATDACIPSPFQLHTSVMDFIERWLHLSPDNGSGLAELIGILLLSATLPLRTVRLWLAAAQRLHRQ